MERDFKGVWIPKEIWLNEDLSLIEKHIFTEIDSLAKNRECFASNDYFSKFLGISIRQVQNILASLKTKGFISVEIFYKKGTKEVEKRIISPLPVISFTTSRKNLHDPHEENYVEGHEENCVTPHEKNCVDINTSFNNTVITNTNINTSNIKKINKKEITAELESQFESLWKLYPRKQGDKKKAKASYIKAIKSGETTYETVKNGIEMYIKYNEYHNVQEDYIKHGSTWFNQSCWDNDYTCKPKLVQGKRHGFLGLLLNEMDMQQSNVIDYEGTIINEQERDTETAFFTAKQLSQSL
jgi:hypothetical protein